MIEPVLGLAAAAVASLSVILVATKLANREIQRWRGVRSAHFVAAVGELVSRRMLPAIPPRAWGEDPLFHQVLGDYRRLVTGADRDHIDTLAEALGVYDVLLRRVRRPHRQGVRLRALTSLAELAQPRHVEILRELAADRNGNVRVNAIRGLTRLNDLEWVPWILDHASRSQPWEAARCADALVGMGRAAVPHICGWVENETGNPAGSVTVVALAARVLGLIGDPTAEPILIELLKSEQPEWRVAAASALEHAGTPAAIPHLLHAVEDRAARVRARVAVALGTSAEPSVGRPLSGLLNDESWWVRQNAAAALGNLPGGTDYLLAALHGPDPYAAGAALNQLTISGELGRAAKKVSEGVATDQERHIAALARVPA